jgi:cytochrome c oxidase assembly protein subunit 15
LKRFRALAIAAAVAVYGQIVLGAVVRITNSGLGCPDWPACQGRLVPDFADAHVVIEYAHRLSGTAAGVLMVATAITALVMYRRGRGPGGVSRGLASAAVAGVLLIVVQGVLGGVTVLTGNTPFTVAIHLGNALLVLGAAVLVALWAGRSLPGASPVVVAGRERGGTAGLWAGAFAAFVIVLTGAYVVGAGAGGACASWPLCGNAFHSDFADIHMLHRIIVALGSVAIVRAAWLGARRWRGSSMSVVAYVTLGLLALEVAVGGLQAVNGLPAPLRAIHVALASGVWTGLVLLVSAAWLEARSQSAGARAPRRGLAGAES